MKIDDGALKRAFAPRRLSNPETLLDRTCPREAEVSLFFEASTPRKKKLEIVDHIFECPVCFQVFHLFLEFDRNQTEGLTAAAARTRERPSTLMAPRGKFPRLLPAAALSVLLLIAAALMITSPRREALRSRQGPIPVIELIQPAGRLADFGRPVFKWRETTDSDHYVLQLFDYELRLLWSSEPIYAQTFELPASVTEYLLPGRSYFWMVTAFPKEGKPAESELVSFTLPSR